MMEINREMYLMQTMLGLLLIGGLPLNIACYWVETWWLGEVRNKMKFKVQCRGWISSYDMVGV